MIAAGQLMGALSVPVSEAFAFDGSLNDTSSLPWPLSSFALWRPAVYRIGALAPAVMSPLQAGAILGTLTVATRLQAYSLVHQMGPGSRHRIPPALVPPGITISLAIANFPRNHLSGTRAGNSLPKSGYVAYPGVDLGLAVLGTMASLFCALAMEKSEMWQRP